MKGTSWSLKMMQKYKFCFDNKILNQQNEDKLCRIQGVFLLTMRGHLIRAKTNKKRKPNQQGPIDQSLDC